MDEKLIIPEGKEYRNVLSITLRNRAEPCGRTKRVPRFIKVLVNKKGKSCYNLKKKEFFKRFCKHCGNIFDTELKNGRVCLTCFKKVRKNQENGRDLDYFINKKRKYCLIDDKGKIIEKFYNKASAESCKSHYEKKFISKLFVALN